MKFLAHYIILPKSPHDPIIETVTGNDLIEATRLTAEALAREGYSEVVYYPDGLITLGRTQSENILATVVVREYPELVPSQAVEGVP
jgi:hypothetical protein